jgi:biopolymer transport protein ExbB/TolQ
MLTLFKQGGWVMYPSLLFSAISIAVILEQVVFYILSRASSFRTFDELMVFVKEYYPLGEAGIEKIKVYFNAKKGGYEIVQESA